MRVQKVFRARVSRIRVAKLRMLRQQDLERARKREAERVAANLQVKILTFTLNLNRRLSMKLSGCRPKSIRRRWQRWQRWKCRRTREMERTRRAMRTPHHGTL